MKLSKAIEGYIIDRIAEGFSQSTISSYESSLLLLTEFLNDPEIESIKAEDLKRFFYYLRTDYKPQRPNSKNMDPLTSAALHGKWKALRSLWGWASEQFKIENIAKALKMPRVSSSEIIPFSKDEVKELLYACEFTSHAKTKIRKTYQQHRPTELRDRLIIKIFLDTGIRLGECTRLKVGDVDPKVGIISISPFGQGQKTSGRVVYLGDSTKKIAWYYLAKRETLDRTDPFLLNDEGQQLDENAIKSLCRRLGERTGISKVHPHRFRHTFAIQYLRNGGDIYTLQKLLGHKTLDMVKRYLALAEVDKAAAHRRASPVDNWGL